MSKAMTRKAWLEYLQKAVDEFDWDAVEQGQCEPVAWMDAEGDVYRKEPPEGWCPPHIPLYAHTKREWVGLTDEEFDFLVPYCHNEFDLNDYKEFARAIEAKLKEKMCL
jgi:hypothetical protein